MLHIKNCRNCGKEILIKFKCRLKTDFCNHPCYSLWRGKTIKGKLHPHWIKSKKALKYSTVHMWLRRDFGKANKCENPICEKKSNNFQWSLKKGKKYIRNRNNFWMLCRICHAKYDIKSDTGKKISEANKGRTPWNKKII